MTTEGKLRAWPFYGLALLVAVVGVVLLLDGPDPRPLENMTGKVTSLSWVDDSDSEPGLAMTYTLEGSDRVLLLITIGPARREIYDRLIGSEADVWIDPSLESVSGWLPTYRMEARIGAREGVEPVIVSYDHKGLGEVGASRVRWGAVLITVAAVLVVVGRLVDVWNRHRREILGR